VHISEVGFSESEGKVDGMRAEVSVNNESVNLVVKGSVGTTQIFPGAAALAVAFAFDIPLSNALKALEAYRTASWARETSRREERFADY